MEAAAVRDTRGKNAYSAQQPGICFAGLGHPSSPESHWPSSPQHSLQASYAFTAYGDMTGPDPFIGGYRDKAKICPENSNTNHFQAKKSFSSSTVDQDLSKQENLKPKPRAHL